MTRFVALASALAVLTGSTSTALAARITPPHWLLEAERGLLQRGFENAKPTRVHYIPYPKKISVVFEFDHVVICGMCSGPSNASIPRGRVIRVSFDRRTHDLAGASGGWAMRFCESVGNQPPKSDCLHR